PSRPPPAPPSPGLSSQSSSSPGLSRGPHGESARWKWRVRLLAVPLSDGSSLSPPRRHPRACPGDTGASDHGVCGGCRAAQCPFLMEVLGSGPGRTEGGGEDDGGWGGAMEVEGGMPFSALSCTGSSGQARG